MFFHTHVHSEFSCLDGMADIGRMVAKAAQLGQPGIALTDHGNMSGVFTLYNAARKHGIKPYLGVEAYVVSDIEDKAAARYHLTLVAYTTVGYQNLVRLSSLSHRRDHYHFKPRISSADLIAAKAAGASSGIACLTGCYFGEVCQTIVSEPTEDVGISKAKRLVRFYQSIFDRVFVEVQHHRTQHDVWDDDRLARALHRLSIETGVPPIITNDCHYCDKGEKHLHNAMKSIAYSADPGDVAFPGDAYHLASGDWVRSHYVGHEELWSDAQSSYAELLEAHELRIPPLDKYQYHVPIFASDPLDQLKHLVEDELERRGLGDDYRERVDYELGVISDLGFADYFLLVHDYVQWCHNEGIMVMARGSAAGSLVCWLLGFTQVDPIKWTLTFDRFLTPDRVRPPDIDLDIEDVRRSDVVDYLGSKFDVVQIGTYNRLSVDEDTGRGGVFVQFLAAQRKLLGDQFKAKYGSIKTLHDLEEVDAESAALVRNLASVPLRRSPGAHAAGFVISAPPSHSIADWLPTMLIPSSDTTVTQMMMDDVEDAGYIKVDLLGLRSLTTVRRCLELLGREGLSWIPLDDKATFKELRKGRTGTGLFQVEGYTAAKGCREMKVKSVHDLILVNALYRPATIDSGYTSQFLANRQDPSQVSYPHLIFERHLAETHGVPCFQEQVLAILRDLGMPAAELNAFLKAVKGKHAVGGVSAESTAIFDRNRARFNGLCEAVGMIDQEIEVAWDLVEGFASYGFNRAHATAYSLMGYQMGYLKTHHPVEFHAALLETSVGSPKEDLYVAETRRCGVPVLGACVNKSKELWAIDPTGKAVRRGIASIKGVGIKAASAVVAEQPFESIEDLIERTPARAVTGGRQWSKDQTLTGTMASMRQAGALKSLGLDPL